MKLVVERMELEDVGQVLEVDRESYTLPWPASAYRREILHNRNARYLVLRCLSDSELDSARGAEEEQKPRLPFPFLRWTRGGDGHHVGRPGQIIGYAGMWLMIDEAHITTIAVRESWRGRGLGELLLASMIQSAHEMGAERLTLEVRVSNESAQNLYRKYGFQEGGLRRRYYSDNNEDAYIMTTNSIANNQYRAQFDSLVDVLRARLAREEDATVQAPVFAETERPDPAGSGE